MSYKALRTRVETAEKALATQLDLTQSGWYKLKATASEAFTPVRILGTGMLSGLLIGFAAPWARMGGTLRIVELATSVANMVGALQAQEAAEEASDAADSASEVAVETAAVAQEANVATAQTQAVAQQVESVTQDAQQAVHDAETVTGHAQEAVAEAEAAGSELRSAARGSAGTRPR